MRRLTRKKERAFFLTIFIRALFARHGLRTIIGVRSCALRPGRFRKILFSYVRGRENRIHSARHVLFSVENDACR